MDGTDEVRGRPVYILGAGFSHAIHDQMPLTDDLGEAIRATLGFEWPAGEAATFEERLTLLSTPLPFLEGHKNTERRALAERTTAAIASELDARVEATTAGSPPNWLLQLVALWHAEQAVVITFNYDTLVEQATTYLRPTVLIGGGSSPSDLHGWQVAYPSPTAVNVRTYDEMSAPTLDSFQLLKLHGSLNWYWALGDGATLVRDATIDGFGSPSRTSEQDAAGVRLLDRFLVPPVTSKDSYYSVHLVHVLWRAAYKAIQGASKLTVIGYSMPPADRIAAELVRSLPEGCPVELVNWDVGESSDQRSPFGRARALGLNVVNTWSGDDAVKQFASDQMDKASEALADDPVLSQLPHSSVVVAVRPPGSVLGPSTFTLRSDNKGVVRAVDLGWMEAGRSDMPPHEHSLNYNLPRGTATVEDFITGARLRESTDAGVPFEFQQNEGRYRLVGVRRASLDRWSIILGLHAPAHDPQS